MISRIDVPTVLRALHIRVGAWLTRDEGQGLTEYALILALIGIVAMVSLRFLGGRVTSVLTTVATPLQS